MTACGTIRSLVLNAWRWGHPSSPLLSSAQWNPSSSLTTLFSVRHYRIKQHPRKGWRTLTSKRGNQNFQKGRGVKGAGANSSTGQYRVLPSHSPHYIIPDMRGCNVCSSYTFPCSGEWSFSPLYSATACMPTHLAPAMHHHLLSIPVHASSKEWCHVLPSSGGMLLEYDCSHSHPSFFMKDG
jgi:hypothetical protein